MQPCTAESTTMIGVKFATSSTALANLVLQETNRIGMRRKKTAGAVTEVEATVYSVHTGLNRVRRRWRCGDAERKRLSNRKVSRAEARLSADDVTGAVRPGA